MIDATSLPLNSLSQNWAAYKAHRPGAKLHIVYDPKAAAPVHFQVTAARSNEITMAKAMDLQPSTTYVFDLVWRFRCSPISRFGAERTSEPKPHEQAHGSCVPLEPDVRPQSSQQPQANIGFGTRGYYDFSWWAKIAEAGSIFVTRLKKNTPTTIVKKRRLSKNAKARGVLADYVVMMPKRTARANKSPIKSPLREIHVQLDTCAA